MQAAFSSNVDGQGMLNCSSDGGETASGTNGQWLWAEWQQKKHPRALREAEKAGFVPATRSTCNMIEVAQGLT